jgi:hypothetical protein
MASQAEGLYALIDYVNFKGEGLFPQERYNNIGWGLLQVIDDMRGYPEGRIALREFSRSARRILWRRVLNSPPERDEMRWVAGWRKRVKSYAGRRFKDSETAQALAAAGPDKT